MWEGYCEFGGVEVVNSQRARALAAASGVQVYKGKSWPQLETALGAGTDFSDITQAPWYDPDSGSPSAQFLGVYGLGLGGQLDSVRSVPVTENAGDGAVNGAPRRAGRPLRQRAHLIGLGLDGLAYGRIWLANVLELAGCYTGDCDRSDVRFFNVVPGTEEEAAEASRYLKFASTISGPFTVEEGTYRDADGYEVFYNIVEWTWSSERPYIFGPPRDVALDPAEALALIQDQPINWMPTPSGELEDTTVLTTAVNLCTNPSCESAITGWTFIPGTTGVGACAKATQTTAFGTSVARSTWTTATTAAGGGHYIDVPVTAGLVYSFGFNHVQTSLITRIRMDIEWRTASGGSVVSTDSGTEKVTAASTVYGTTDFKVENKTAPATATIARVKIISVAGISFANWPISGWLQTDALMANLGTTVLPYFDGTLAPALGDYVVGWNGTAELSASTRTAITLIGTSVSANPGLEVDATGWAGAAVVVTGSSPASYLTTARSQDGRALGSWAYRSRIVGNGSTAVSGTATLSVTHTVSLTGVPAGRLLDLVMWARALAMTPQAAADAGTLAVSAQFKNVSNVDVGAAVPMTTDPRVGGGYSAKRVAIPATATQVVITASAVVTWQSGASDAVNKDVRVYADGATVTYYGSVS